MAHVQNIAILIFDEVEVLDFSGPFEVFSVAARLKGDPPVFNVYTIAPKSPVVARGGLTVIPHFLVDNCPQPDILLVPGGWGTRPLLSDQSLLAWLAEQAEQVSHLLSVCTGSLLLGAAGLLDGLGATTHHSAFDLLAKHAPNAVIRRELRVVDNGKIVTSAGISAGIDMALHMVARLLGVQHARETAAYMEYPWSDEN